MSSVLADIPVIYEEVADAITSGRKLSVSGKVYFWESIEDSATTSASYSDTQTINFETLFTDAQQELSDYINLPPGWDGYKGFVFADSTVKNAVAVLEHLYSYFKDSPHALREVTPGPVADGSIDIELSDGNKTLTVTVFENGALGVYLKNGDYVSEIDSDYSWSPLEDGLSWFHGKVLGQMQPNLADSPR